MVILTVVGVLLSGGAYFAMRSTAPNEADRVKHVAGFSLIHPPGWGVGSMSLPGPADARAGVRFSPAKFVGDSPGMGVTRLPEPIDPAGLTIDGYSQETIGGSAAWVRRRFSKRAMNFDAYVERSGWWFHFTMYLPGLEAAKEEDYRPYIQSLRLETPAITTTSRSITSRSTTSQPASSGPAA